MRVADRFIVPGVLILLCAVTFPAWAQMRAVALAGDPAPGVAGATFTSFTTTSGHPVCDATGHAAFAALTSVGSGGLWTDDLGSLSLLALGGASVPWYPATGTLSSISQPILSDNHRVAFGGIATTPSTLSGVWVQDGAAIGFVAGTGTLAATYNGATTFNLVPPPGGNMGYRFSRNGELGLMGNDAANTPCLWRIDPPPLANHPFCAAATGVLINPDVWTWQNFFVFNNEWNYALEVRWYSGSGTIPWGLAMGGCGLLAPVLVDGDIAPPTGSSIPPATNVSGINELVPPDINNANAMVFPALIYNGGVTSSNDEVFWLKDGTGFHVVAREGDGDPALAPGETIWPAFSIVTATPRLLVSDDGSVAFEGQILPSGSPAVFLRKPNGTLHVLARDGGTPPGYPGWTYSFPVGTPIEMNHFGQVLMQASIWTPGHTAFGTAIFATDDNATLQPVFLNGSTYTVRPGLTGTVLLSQGAPVSSPLMTGGSDGQPRNFSDLGEYFFHGTFTPTGGGSALDGVFAVKGPGLTLAVGPDAPRTTSLAAVAPNPVAGATQLVFDLARPGEARLEILDLAGRRVKTLRRGMLQAGHYSERWAEDDDGGHPVARGVYFVHLYAGGESIARRLVVVQ